MHLTTRRLLQDGNNEFTISSIAFRELIDLYKSKYYQPIIKTGKQSAKKKLSDIHQYKNVTEVYKAIEEMGITITPFSEKHVKTYETLSFTNENKDWNDKFIVSQAIADKITLISSDSDFEEYETQGLKLFFNKR
ncbi:MAG: PIN domain-containing protein [Bacteroidetes bacterium]|nr:PIN domain-containing protein [Bacteroidota bacterium]